MQILGIVRFIRNFFMFFPVSIPQIWDSGLRTFVASPTHPDCPCMFDFIIRDVSDLRLVPFPDQAVVLLLLGLFC